MILLNHRLNDYVEFGNKNVVTIDGVARRFLHNIIAYCTRESVPDSTRAMYYHQEHDFQILRSRWLSMYV